jgi:hypothetical protein
MNARIHEKEYSVSHPQISRRNTVLYLIGFVTLSVRSSECDEPVPELLLSLSNSLYDEKKEIRTIAFFTFSINFQYDYIIISYFMVS